MRYGRSPDGDFVLMADVVGAEFITTLSPNEADALYDALVLFRAEREQMAPVDEPVLITGEA